MPIRILLAGDHTLLRQAVREHLDRKRGDAEVVVSEAGDQVEIMALLRRHCPDVVILGCGVRLWGQACLIDFAAILT